MGLGAGQCQGGGGLGRADTQPLFPDDPFVPSNRRVTITLLHEAPPIPVNLKP